MARWNSARFAASAAVRGALGIALGIALAGPSSAQSATMRASVDSNGNQADDYSASNPPAISADGRFVAFDSPATNLVHADRNGAHDVFVHDRVTGATVRVSVASNGSEANSESLWPAISADGRFVAFVSFADNLVAGDTNWVQDIFVHDRDPDGNGLFDDDDGVTTRVSVRSNGAEANNYSLAPSISGDGMVVAFQSYASNLVVGDRNQQVDVFVHDRATGTTRRASVSSSGGDANSSSSYPSISADGTTVAFSSGASNLVAGDTNQTWDLFVRDLVNGVTTRVSVDSSGAQADGPTFGLPALSSDGAVVAFHSDAANLVAGDVNASSDIFVHDRTTGTTGRVSVDSSGREAGGGSFRTSLSADGAIVTFESLAADLVANDTNHASDVFMHERATGATTLASGCGGVAGNGASFYAALAPDGRFVAFGSLATDLVAHDTNGAADIFVADRTWSETDASWSNYGQGYPGTLGIPSMTASADPVLETTITLDVANSYGQPTVGFLLVGVDAVSIPTSAGGTLLVAPLALLRLELPVAGASLPATIPSDPRLCGVSAFLQTLEADPGASHSISFTPGLLLTFGR